jgi:DNA repair protein RadC
MAITDWPEGERPRERLLAHGPEALSDAELLAIYLRVGVRGKSAVDLARDLLQRFDGRLSRLAEASLEELASVSGIGMAKAAQAESQFRTGAAGAGARNDNPRHLFVARQGTRLAAPETGNRQNEVFMALWLDAQNRLLKAEELFSGTLTQTSVYPREVVKSALAIMLLPLSSRTTTRPALPSLRGRRTADQSLKDALAMVDVKVLDHFIVAGNTPPLSFAERGLL